MDSSGNNNKRKRRDDNSPSRYKRQRFGVPLDNQSTSEQPKVKYSAQQRLLKIRAQQALELQAENPTFKGSTTAPQPVETVVKFPLRDQQNKSSEFNREQQKKSAQGRLNQYKDVSHDPPKLFHGDHTRKIHNELVPNSAKPTALKFPQVHSNYKSTAAANPTSLTFPQVNSNYNSPPVTNTLKFPLAPSGFRGNSESASVMSMSVKLSQTDIFSRNIVSTVGKCPPLTSRLQGMIANPEVASVNNRLKQYSPIPAQVSCFIEDTKVKLNEKLMSPTVKFNEKISNPKCEFNETVASYEAESTVTSRFDKFKSDRCAPYKSKAQTIYNNYKVSPNPVNRRSCDQGCSTNGISLEDPPFIKSYRQETVDTHKNVTSKIHNSPVTGRAGCSTNFNTGTLDNYTDDCDMDWSPDVQEEIISDIRLVRETISAQNQTSFHTWAPYKQIEKGSQVGAWSDCNNLYVVIDTNIFLNKLQILSSILKIDYEDGTYPILLIPWMVTQELDFFKDRYNITDKQNVGKKVLKSMAMRAIRFVNENLIMRNPRLRCQTALEAAEDELKIMTSDDWILSCCIQAGERNRVMLLSGDVNLRNKAIINGCEAQTVEDVMTALNAMKKLKPRVDLIRETSDIVSRLCSFIIYSEWKQHGGDEYPNRFKHMPWNFPDCIQYMKENYSRVFRPFLQKQCQIIINDLHDILIVNEDLAEETKFMELALSLLIFLKKGLSRYQLNIERTIEEIKILQKNQ